MSYDALLPCSDDASLHCSYDVSLLFLWCVTTVTMMRHCTYNIVPIVNHCTVALNRHDTVLFVWGINALLWSLTTRISEYFRFLGWPNFNIYIRFLIYFYASLKRLWYRIKQVRSNKTNLIIFQWYFLFRSYLTSN